MATSIVLWVLAAVITILAVVAWYHPMKKPAPRFHGFTAAINIAPVQEADQQGQQHPPAPPVAVAPTGLSQLLQAATVEWKINPETGAAIRIPKEGPK